MCGRFTLTIEDYGAIAALLGVDLGLAARHAHRPRFNVAPTDEHWIVRASGEASRELIPASWGVGAARQILSRSENARARTMLREASAGHRCLVPADGFFEWMGDKGDRRPVWFHRPAPQAASARDRLVLLAAICTEGARGFSFSILTTSANEVVAPVHDRMPVVVDVEDVGRFLSTDSPKELARLLRPAPAAALVATEVDKRVNTVGNDDAACLAPPTRQADAQPSKRTRQLRLF